MMSWLRRLPQAPVTSALLLVNVVVYLLMAGFDHHWFAFSSDVLVRAGANVVLPPGAAADVSSWRVLTAAFIHVNLVHLLMNMMVLVQLGVLSERFVGGGLLASVYVLTGVCGNLLSSAWASAHGRPLLSAGASGAIMGLLGMVAVLAFATGQKPLAKALLRNAAFIIALGLGLSFSGHGLVDNGAHLGGLATGAAVGWARVKLRQPLPGAANVALIGLSFALTLAAFVWIVVGAGTR
jgi:rhomboid protease GluP